MRTELFSVRSSAEELSLLNESLRNIVSDLDSKSSIRVLFKTEIDCNPQKIKNDLMSSLASDNPPELYIYVNALNTKDSSSFRKLFTPLITRLEKDLPEGGLAEDGKTQLYPNIKVYTMTELEGDYPAYCFAIRNRKVIVLPRISLVGGDLSEYLWKAVNCAKEIFSQAFTQCPEGYVYLPKESKLSKLTALLFKKNTASTDADTEKSTEQKNPDTTSDVSSIDEAAVKAVEVANTAETDALCIPAIESPAEPPVSKATLILNDSSNIDTENGENSENSHNNTEDSKEDTPAEDSDTEATESDKKKKGGFKAFLKSLIPMKGDDTRTILTKSVVLVAITAFLVAIGMLLNFYVIEPWINSRNMGDVREIFYSKDVVTDDSDDSGDDTNARNWDGLKKINKEIVGWVKINNTDIDYPVLHHKGDSQHGQYYLYRNYKKDPSDFGSIFVDYRCPKGVDSKQIILHGHNMSADGSMFTSLLKYARVDGWTKGNVEYYKKHPTITFDTPKSNGEWVIFSVMKINVSNSNETAFNYLMGDFESEAQFMNFIYNIKELSYLKVDVPINEDDQLLTLSTCSYEQQNTRTVIVARKIREDENVNKYIKKVKEHTPVSKVESTFSEQLEAGKIKWYDGSGNLDGDEQVEYLETAKIFTVKFVDARGKTIASQRVMEGADATAPSGNPPRKAADGTYYYKFSRWDKSFKNVTEDLVIKPLFTKHKMDLPKPTTRPTIPEEDDTEAPIVTQKPTNAPEPKPPATTTAPPVNTTTDPVEQVSP